MVKSHGGCSLPVLTAWASPSFTPRRRSRRVFAGAYPEVEGHSSQRHAVPADAAIGTMALPKLIHLSQPANGKTADHALPVRPAAVQRQATQRGAAGDEPERVLGSSLEWLAVVRIWFELR